MQRACIVDASELYNFAAKRYGIFWNDACDMFQSYSDHGGYKLLESECINDLSIQTDVDTMSTEELADRIVELFIETLAVPEGYALMLEG